MLRECGPRPPLPARRCPCTVPALASSARRYRCRRLLTGRVTVMAVTTSSFGPGETYELPAHSYHALDYNGWLSVRAEEIRWGHICS